MERYGEFAYFLTAALSKMDGFYSIVCVDDHVPVQGDRRVYVSDGKVHIGNHSYPLWDIVDGLDGMAVVLVVCGRKGQIRLYTNKPTASKYTEEQIEEAAKCQAKIYNKHSPVTMRQVEDQYFR